VVNLRKDVLVLIGMADIGNVDCCSSPSDGCVFPLPIFNRSAGAAKQRAVMLL
jgi:hypothetical protein